MNAFDELVTVPGVRLAEVEQFVPAMSLTDLFQGLYHVVVTSGTTGKRGYFLFNRAEWRTVAMAGVARALSWSGANPRAGGRGAITTSTVPWHMTARAGAELRRLGMDTGRLSLDAGESLGEIVTKLNAYQPSVIMVYPSLMQLLAAEQKAGRLKIAPQHIQCTSEVMTDEARSEIESAFHVAPADIYAASECGCLAASCVRNEGLHLSEDLLIVEVVDDKGRAVPPGTAGARSLVTVLPSRTMPLIRYELTDRLALLSEPCGCGKPYARIGAVGGRQGDILRFPAKTGGEVEIAPAQISAALRGLSIRGWQLSVSPNQLAIHCVCTPGDFSPERIARRLGELLEERGAVLPVLRVERIDQLERGVTGKNALVKRISR